MQYRINLELQRWLEHKYYDLIRTYSRRAMISMR